MPVLRPAADPAGLRRRDRRRRGVSDLERDRQSLDRCDRHSRGSAARPDALGRRQAGAGLAPALLCPCHLDLKTDHIILNGGRTTFIDLDSAAMADPACEIAQIAARRDMLPDQMGPPRAPTAALCAALVEDLHRPASPQTRANVRPAYAIAAITSAVYLVQHLDQHCPQRITTILDIVKRQRAGTGAYPEPGRSPAAPVGRLLLFLSQCSKGVSLAANS